MIPLTMLIFMVGLFSLQYNRYSFLDRYEKLNKTTESQEEIDKLKKEFEDYKKRVDSLTLKAGFKL